jgi:thiol:disulfide interchange protein
MKKNTLLFTIAACVLAVSVAVFSGKTYAEPKKDAEKGIVFIEQDWDKALKAAKSQGKLVFIDIYATWCGPCKLLKKNTFTDQKVGDFFNKNFVNVSIDGEKGVGPSLAQKYGITAYPSLIVTNAEGKPVLYTMGYIDPETLLKFADAALKKK